MHVQPKTFQKYIALKSAKNLVTCILNNIQDLNNILIKQTLVYSSFTRVRKRARVTFVKFCKQNSQDNAINICSSTKLFKIVVVLTNKQLVEVTSWHYHLLQYIHCTIVNVLYTRKNIGQISLCTFSRQAR